MSPPPYRPCCQRVPKAGAVATALCSALPRSLVLGMLLLAGQAGAADILFIGNSFTYGHGSPVQRWRSASVTDLNGQGVGGVPALFKSFARQAGLSYNVFLETQPGAGLDWHLENKLPLLGQRPWDIVVLQGFSTLDPNKPGDPALLKATVKRMAAFLRERNGAIALHLMATFPRADAVYRSGGAWYGKTVEQMARDIRAGYDQAAHGVPGVKGVAPVGEAWIRAFHSQVADPDPYDGIEPGQVDLWGADHYHASTAGYYLSALVLFGSISGRDPRWLGEQECAAAELGLPAQHARALQHIAAEQLQASGQAFDAALPPAPHSPALPCN